MRHLTFVFADTGSLPRYRRHLVLSEFVLAVRKINAPFGRPRRKNNNIHQSDNYRRCGASLTVFGHGFGLSSLQLARW